MSRAVLVLAGKTERDRASRWIAQAPVNTRVEFKAPRRSVPQNDRMWAMLTVIARKVEWHGIRLTADDWKLIFMDALRQELRLVPNLGGTGFVNLGRSTSDLSKSEHSDLTTLIEAFAAERGVDLGEPMKDAA
jgi:hypothetical protein